jgi:hypothetical protein
MKGEKMITEERLKSIEDCAKNDDYLSLCNFLIIKELTNEIRRLRILLEDRHYDFDEEEPDVTSTTKEILRAINYLCTLDSGREIFKGDKVWRTAEGYEVTAQCIYTDKDGDNYLCFEEGGNAWISGPFNGHQQLR